MILQSRALPLQAKLISRLFLKDNRASLFFQWIWVVSKLPFPYTTGTYISLVALNFLIDL